MSCNKCRQCVPSEGDSWCLGCCGWESLQTELASVWHHPGLRALANDTVVNAVRAVRSLRNFSSSLHSAEIARASVQDRDRTSTRAHGQSVSRPLPPPPAPPPVPVKREDSYTYEEESEEEETGPGAASKANPSRRPAEPREAPRSHKDEDRQGRHRGRSATPRRSTKKRRRTGTRGGKKHPRLYRTLERPELKVHRKKTSAFWEQTPSRQGVRSLERHR